jgi:peroxiredoxin Q/BCP
MKLSYINFRAIVAALAIPGAIALTTGCTGSSSAAKTPNASVDAPADSTKSDSEMLKVGDTAPAFEATTDTGETVRLADYRGKQNVVLVFYPGDNTPGCTSQLCAIRDDWADFTGKDVAVFGVNPADVASKKKFTGKYNFPFPLIPDTDKKLVRAYGTAGLLFTTRTVYGIDKEGKIVFAERGMPDNSKILASF